jgi:hypothetical protein
MRESSMPTDAALALKSGIARKRADATDLRTAIFLVPVALCLLSIIVAFESPAFAAAIAMLGAE